MSIPPRPRVVVTGGAGGLGRAFAMNFAAKNATILIADIDLAGAEATKSMVESAGSKAFVTQCDVAKPTEVEALAQKAIDVMGGADVVINNAGVAVAGPVGEIPLSDWEWIVGINLWGVIYGCHYFAPMMKKQSSGHFINVASMAAIAQAPNMAPYNVTKAGVLALSETLAAEWKPNHIGVTVLCPSFFQTNILNSGRTTNLNTGLQKVIEKVMRTSKVQASDVAEYAIHAAEKGRLYALPHKEGKLAWGLKRLAPQLFHGTLIARAAKRTAG
jgi:NAD(P)-dependent dehydrogenase (short-subunit alcohol dehydrogenase family)